MDPVSRKAASAAICRHLLQSPHYTDASRLGAYLAFNDEADLGLFIERAHQDNKTVFVPVIEASGTVMRFAPLHPDSGLQRNRFGIPEPVVPSNEYVDPKELHWVLVPLLAFDESGNRLGMGAGFYDRAFGFRMNNDPASGPLLCGAAFTCQRLDAIEGQSWDVPLDMIATEEGITDAR